MSRIARRTLWGERLVFALLLFVFAAGLMPTHVIGPVQMAVAAEAASPPPVWLNIR